MSASTNACDEMPGFFSISKNSTCHVASKFLKQGYGGQVSLSHMPKGCYIASGIVQFNTHGAGSASANARPVCTNSCDRSPDCPLGYVCHIRAGHHSACRTCSSFTNKSQCPINTACYWHGETCKYVTEDTPEAHMIGGYGIMSASTNDCDELPGVFPISKSSFCHAASKFLKQGYGGQVSLSHMPKGCYIVSGIARFNTHGAGSASASARPVCTNSCGDSSDCPLGYVCHIMACRTCSSFTNKTDCPIDKGCFWHGETCRTPSTIAKFERTPAITDEIVERNPDGGKSSRQTQNVSAIVMPVVGLSFGAGLCAGLSFMLHQSRRSRIVAAPSMYDVISE